MSARGAPRRPILKYLWAGLSLAALFAAGWHLRRASIDEPLPIVRFGVVPQPAEPAGSDRPGSAIDPAPGVNGKPAGDQAVPEAAGVIPPATSAAPEPEPEPEPEVPSPAETARIVIHHHAGDVAGAARARELRGRLAARDGITVEIRAVPMRVSLDNMRIFFASDRRQARDARDLAGSGSMPIRDFSHYRPLPRPGTIEIWLASSPGDVSATGRAGRESR